MKQRVKPNLEVLNFKKTDAFNSSLKKVDFIFLLSFPKTVYIE